MCFQVTIEDRYIMENGRYLMEFVWKRVSKPNPAAKPGVEEAIVRATHLTLKMLQFADVSPVF